MANDMNPQLLAIVRLLLAVGNISAWGGGRLYTINAVLLADMAELSSTWSRPRPGGEAQTSYGGEQYRPEAVRAVL